jgi:hypothetical protein|tara:strand:- start:198 stop:302 length:105 start_codon:yes stop_codon:yes gene_type:complete
MFSLAVNKYWEMSKMYGYKAPKKTKPKKKKKSKK